MVIIKNSIIVLLSIVTVYRCSFNNSTNIDTWVGEIQFDKFSAKTKMIIELIPDSIVNVYSIKSKDTITNTYSIVSAKNTLILNDIETDEYYEFSYQENPAKIWPINHKEDEINSIDLMCSIEFYHIK